ncbi:MAG TPA: hypothetical protein VFR34_00180 [Paracoccaceae bacterium]|nr:hypothetical protein [Paracoccaceae bacterium]
MNHRPRGTTSSTHKIAAIHLVLKAARCATVALGAAAGLLVLLSASPAAAHTAVKGWAYPYDCCAGYDCREIPATAISEKTAGYIINGTGEIVGYSDPRVRISPDGEYHWCSVAGSDEGRTICLFVPPKAY